MLLAAYFETVAVARSTRVRLLKLTLGWLLARIFTNLATSSIGYQFILELCIEFLGLDAAASDECFCVSARHLFTLINDNLSYIFER